MAKRSPILGYNHNVRYRGLIFHVQTEDSGLLSPHLFTHLFYEGVIISTRKLVYDAGADEGAIKSLMQAQHKAVMKDLKRGAFDDKMDTNLAGNPGLLPRGAKETGEAEPLKESLRDSQPFIPDPQGYLTEPGIEIVPEEPSAPVRRSEPIVPPPPIRPGTEPIDPDQDATQPIEVLEHFDRPLIARTATPPPIPARAKTPAPVMIQPRNGPRADTEVQAPRTKTAEKVRATLPPPPDMSELDPPTLNDPAELAAQMFASSSAARAFKDESAPEIEIVPEEPPRRRATRDTDIESPSLIAIEDLPRVSDGVPSQVGMAGSGRSPHPTLGSTPPPPAQRTSFSAATLPPSRPVTRPPSRPALTPQNVMSRPVERQRHDSDAIEVYAPPPGGADPAPGAERPGQYAQHKRNSKQFATPEPPRERSSSAQIPMPRERSSSAQIPTPSRERSSSAQIPTPPRERSSSTPIPAGLGRPLRPSEQNRPVPRPILREPTPGTSTSGIPQPVVPQQTLPRSKPPTPTNRTPTPLRPTPGRAPTPQRIQSTQPLIRPSSGSGGVVMTRPAVIVGAPAKPVAQRVRKAREEEGRGFGQGLISEKSLDEVILAYLSEDADDK